MEIFWELVLVSSESRMAECHEDVMRPTSLSF